MAFSPLGLMYCDSMPSFRVGGPGQGLQTVDACINRIIDYLEAQRPFPAGGAVMLADLPTVDPEVEGQLWNDTGIVTVSAGAV